MYGGATDTWRGVRGEWRGRRLWRRLLRSQRAAEHDALAASIDDETSVATKMLVANPCVDAINVNCRIASSKRGPDKVVNVPRRELSVIDNDDHGKAMRGCWLPSRSQESITFAGPRPAHG